MTSNDQSIALHFLLAADGSAPSFAAAAWLAQLGGASFPVVCTVIAVQHPLMAGEVSALAPARVTIEARAQQAEQVLAQVSGILRSVGLTHTTETCMDDAAKAIVTRAELLGAQAIVIGRRGQSALRSALLGSVSAEVVRSASVAVIVVNGAAATPVPELALSIPLRILLAIDRSDNALRAADFAARLAHNAAAALHILHVRPTLTLAEALFSPRERLLAHWSAEHAEQALAQPRDVLRREGIGFEEHAVSSDDPALAIVNSAQELGCSLIVMGTRGLGAVEGMLLGSVTQQVLAKAGIPVALVR